MYAFLAHQSACEVLRTVGSVQNTWPPQKRKLPLAGDCVTNQRGYKEVARETDLAELGIEGTPVDLLVPNQTMRSRGKSAHFHLWSTEVPAHAMMRVAPHLLVSGPELVIAQLCGSQAKLDELLDQHGRAAQAEIAMVRNLGLDLREAVIDNALIRDTIERMVAATVVACEFAGTYRLGGAERDTRYQVTPLMSTASLNAVIAQLEGTANKTRTAEVAMLMLEGSASPMETALALFLTLPVNMGGMGLPHPELNAAVDVSDVRGSLSDRDTVTPDALWRDQRVCLEYDSSAFHEKQGPAQLDRDARRANILTACRYSVLRVTPGIIRTVADTELLAQQVAALLGVELDTPNEVQKLRRRRLHALLMPQRQGDATDCPAEGSPNR